MKRYVSKLSVLPSDLKVRVNEISKTLYTKVSKGNGHYFLLLVDPDTRKLVKRFPLTSKKPAGKHKIRAIVEFPLEAEIQKIKEDMFILTVDPSKRNSVFLLLKGVDLTIEQDNPIETEIFEGENLKIQVVKSLSEKPLGNSFCLIKGNKKFKVSYKTIGKIGLNMRRTKNITDIPTFKKEGIKNKNTGTENRTQKSENQDGNIVNNNTINNIINGMMKKGNSENQQQGGIKDAE